MGFKSQNLEYTYLQSGIHHFKWLSRNEESLNEYFDLIIEIYSSVVDEQQTIRILHDYRFTPFLPATSIFPKTRELQSSFPDLRCRIAYLLDDDMSEALIETLTQTLGRLGTRRYFEATQEQDAIKWLLSSR